MVALVAPSDKLEDSLDGPTTTRQLLAGVRVLDLTKATSGPFATQILSDLGAEVIKVEEPPGPRGRPPIDPDHQIGGMDASYLAVNRGKKSVALKLASEEGRQVVYDLARTCDVVIDNFRPGVGGKLGVDPATMQAVNPRIIACSLTGFGPTGAFSRRAAYDITIQGETGAMAFIGKRDPQGRLVPIPMPVGDLVAGMYCAVAIPAALYRRTVTGRGEVLGVSMFDGLLSWLVGHGVHRMNFGEEWDFLDTAIWRTFETSDRPLVIAAHRPAQWARLCRALDREDWIADSRFESVQARVANASELHALIHERMSEHPADDWAAVFDREGVAYAHCVEMSDVLGSALAVDQEMVVEVDDPEIGRVRMFGNPVRTQSGSIQTSAPPMLGAHTEAVLESLGRTPREIADLEARGLIHCCRTKTPPDTKLMNQEMA